jgi:hypothetical protein
MATSDVPKERCSCCLIPSSAPGMSLNEAGLCPVCQNYSPVEVKGELALKNELTYSQDKKREYDCVIPVSGGLDSVYTAYYLTRRMGLRCLGVHYDHGMGSESKLTMLAWIEKEVGIPIVIHSWSSVKSRVLVRDSIRAMLPFGAKSMQAALCRHCGYGIRAAVYSEMVKRELHSVWGKHSMDDIPFRYCQEVKSYHYLFQRNIAAALRSLRGRYRQVRALPVPGTSAIRLMLNPMGYPSMPKSHLYLKNIIFFQFVSWNRQRMLDELEENGVDVRPLLNPHSDCRLPPIVDRVLQSAWTAGKKEIYICNMVRVGQLSKEEGLKQIQAVRDTVLDTSFLRCIGVSDNEISRMFL